MESSVENGSPELLAGPELMTNESEYFAESEADVIYVDPVEITEYYLIIPSQSSEMPG